MCGDLDAPIETLSSVRPIGVEDPIRLPSLSQKTLNVLLRAVGQVVCFQFQDYLIGTCNLFGLVFMQIVETPYPGILFIERCHPTP